MDINHDLEELECSLVESTRRETQCKRAAFAAMFFYAQIFFQAFTSVYMFVTISRER